MGKVIIRDRGFGITDLQRRDVQQAVDDAAKMARGVLTDFENAIWNRRTWDERLAAWRDHPHLATWYGEATKVRPVLRHLYRRMRTLTRWLERRRIVIKTRNVGQRGCDVNTNAWTLGMRFGLRINLCPPWFGAGPRRRAAILVHELVHELGFAHPEGTTTAAEARALAGRNARRACRSPENFEGYYGLFYEPPAAPPPVPDPEHALPPGGELAV